MFLFLKFDTHNNFELFKNNIIHQTKKMPRFLSNYNCGWYSQLYRNFIIIMYANNNSYDVIPPPIHCRFCGIKVSLKNKVYLLGFVFIELWITVAIIIGIIESIIQNNTIDALIILLGSILIVLWKNKEIQEIKLFILNQFVDSKRNR